MQSRRRPCSTLEVGCKEENYVPTNIEKGWSNAFYIERRTESIIRKQE
jgi:hypothetical protein